MNRFVLGCATAATLTCSLSALAHDYAAGDLSIIHPWIAEPPPGAPTAAGFAVIANDGDHEDRLIGVRAAFADRGEVHEMTMDGDVMQMRELAGGLALPPGEPVALEPGGYHVMFIHVTDRPELGEMIPVTLIFEHAGEIEVEFMVQTREDGASHSDHEMDSHE